MNSAGDVMNIDFSRGRVTLVLAPIDGRAGFLKLAGIAEAQLGIPVTAGGEFVVFISRKRSVCKIIFSDDRGYTLVTRRLHQGRFLKLLTSQKASDIRLTPDELSRYLDGEDVQVVHTKRPVFD